MAILLSVGCLGFWVPDFFGEPIAFGALFGTLGCVLLNALCLVVVFYQRGITRQLEALPFVLYLLVFSSIPTLHTQWLVQVVILLFQLILLLVMNSYLKKQASEAAFLSSILLSITALIQPDMAFLLPILWLMLIVHRSFNLRVWLASWLGVAVVALYVILFARIGWLELVDWSEIWVRTKAYLQPILTLVMVSVVGMFFVIVNLIRQNIENTQITTFVWCLMLAFVPCTILIWFPLAHFASMISMALFCLVALATYYFASIQSVTAGSVFLCFIAIWICQYVLPILLCV